MNKDNKSNSIFNKYFKIILFVILLGVSFGITIYFAKAANNDDNKYEVKDIKITNIIDGTANFNSTTDTAGKDANSNNGVVRTYDSIDYNIHYKLSLKSGQTAEVTDDRTVVIDVLIPTRVEGKVNGVPLQPIFDGYSYAELEVDESVETEDKTITLKLSEINATTNTKIKPKIYIKEKTDSSKKSINELPSDKRSSFAVATTVEGFSDVTTTCNNTINNGSTTSCETTVTTKTDYIVNLFKGGSSKDNLTTSFNIGYMIGMVSDASTGIKGKSLPSTVTFTISSSTKINGTSIGTDKDEITFGDSIEQNFTDDLYMCDDCPEKLEVVRVDTNNFNGTPEITTSSSGSVTIKVSNIQPKYNALATNNQYIAFSTGELSFSSVRKSNQVIGDIDISMNSGIANSNTLNLVDKQRKYIGIYRSIINLRDKNSDVNKRSGQAVTNYGQEFDIENNISYGQTGGDELDSLTAYMKIDNSAINLINFEDGDEGSRSSSAYLNDGSANNIVPTVKFYYGEWNTNYLNLTNATGCPSTATSDELMNLYGGPCVSINTSTMKSSNDLILDESQAIGTPLEGHPEYYERGPLLVEFTFESTDENKIKNVSGRIKLRGKIKSDTALINTAHQIVTSAVGRFKEDSSSSAVDYYLSNVLNENGTSLIQNPNNYKKTVYDFNNKTVISSHETLCSTAECAITGNTILVSAVRTTKPTITTMYNDSPKSDFYYYPIEWDIEPVGYTDGGLSSILSSVRVDVYLPSYLRLTNSEAIVSTNKDGHVGITTKSIEPNNITTATLEELNNIKHPEDTINTEYLKYTYILDLIELDKPKLRLYTNIKLNTPKTFSFKGYSTVNYYANVTVPGTSGMDSRVFETIEPVADRSSWSNYSEETNSNVTIHNDANITTQGTLTPRYLEKNESYTYNMQAFNNSNSTFTNTALYYVLPYAGDSAYEDLSSQITATDFKVKLVNSLPSGYIAYYNTSGASANIISNEMHPELASENSWVEWTNPTTEIGGVTAIKIVKTSDFVPAEYFVGEQGISLQITPVGSEVGDIYYNQFHIMTGTTNKKSYFSSRDKVSIYNRIISGFVWEDYDYSGLFDNDESRLENIPVSLYKISDDLENIDANDPTTFVGKEGEECIAETTTNSNGRYRFSGLTEGKYYVKFTYDDKKYVVTKRDATNIDGTPAQSINSKARSYSGGSVAISSIVVFDKLNNSSYDMLNLGLSIRKEFSVDVKKYIKNVTINSDSGTESYDYDKATTVTVSLRNTRNKTARVTYDFVVENTKYFPGYVGLIQDIMPEGMTFNSNLKENQDWVYSGGALYYTGLSSKLLVPNEKYYFSLVLDLDITSGGNYINIVSLDNLVLMGDEVPEFDFSSMDNAGDQGTNTGEGE